VKDVLIPIGVLLFIALFIYAIVKEGRKHQKAPNVFFKKLAEHKGWKYLKEDDGTALHVSNGFEGIGVFSSPSLGKMIPRNVVNGRMNVGNWWLFEHHTRIYEGYVMKWFACVVEAQNDLGGSFVVQSKGKAGTITDNFYTGHKISIEDDWAKGFRLYCNQVRKDRFAVYPSSRNFQLKSVQDLERLIDFSQVALKCLTTNSAVS
jgi:hypothetical protein